MTAKRALTVATDGKIQWVGDADRVESIRWEPPNGVAVGQGKIHLRTFGGDMITFAEATEEMLNRMVKAVWPDADF